MRANSLVMDFNSFIKLEEARIFRQSIFMESVNTRFDQIMNLDEEIHLDEESVWKTARKWGKTGLKIFGGILFVLVLINAPAIIAAGGVAGLGASLLAITPGALIGAAKWYLVSGAIGAIVQKVRNMKKAREIAKDKGDTDAVKKYDAELKKASEKMKVEKEKAKEKYNSLDKAQKEQIDAKAKQIAAKAEKSKPKK